MHVVELELLGSFLFCFYVCEQLFVSFQVLFAAASFQALLIESV